MATKKMGMKKGMKNSGTKGGTFAVGDKGMKGANKKTKQVSDRYK